MGYIYSSRALCYRPYALIILRGRYINEYYVRGGLQLNSEPAVDPRCQSSLRLLCEKCVLRRLGTGVQR